MAAQKTKGTRNPLDPILFRPPFAYQGNKSQLMTKLVPMIPKHTGTFVDLFGGSGIVGATMLANHRCDRVVYNDLEYDLALLQRFMHEFSPDDIIRWQQVLEDRFSEADQALHKSMYEDIRDRYNETRKRFWEDESRGGNESFEPLTLDLSWTEYYDVSEIDRSSIEGSDHANMSKMLFLARHSYAGVLKFSDVGRKISVTPQLHDKVRLPYRNPEALRPYLEAIHGQPIEYLSCNFIDAFVYGHMNVRPRMKSMVERFREITLGLGKGDFVYIDPPYHGSRAGYNGSYDYSTEAYLLAFCTMLNERGVKFLVSNNLDYNRTLFRHWIGMKGMNVFLSNVNYSHTKNHGKNKKETDSSNEVFVTNYPLSPSRHNLPEGIVRVGNVREIMEKDNADYAQFLKFKAENPEMFAAEGKDRE